LSSRYNSAGYTFAWHCTEPPDLADFAWGADPNDDPDDYGNLVDYVQAKAQIADAAEVFAAVGGRDAVLDSLRGGRAAYPYDDGGLAIEDDWAVSWWTSHYPDGTPVVGFTHSRIEHVFEPIGNYRSTVAP